MRSRGMVVCEVRRVRCELGRCGTTIRDTQHVPMYRVVSIIAESTSSKSEKEIHAHTYTQLGNIRELSSGDIGRNRSPDFIDRNRVFSSSPNPFHREVVRGKKAVIRRDGGEDDDDRNAYIHNNKIKERNVMGERAVEGVWCFLFSAGGPARGWHAHDQRGGRSAPSVTGKKNRSNPHLTIRA